MPERAIHKLMTATEPADVAQLAMIECLRQIGDGNNKLGQVLEGVQVELRDIRDRLIRIESSELQTDMVELKAEQVAQRLRIEKLEATENQRVGARSFADAILKYGPFAIAIITALVLLLDATGRIEL